MGDMSDDFKALDAHRRERRALLGVNCPMCALNRPKTNPSKLLPGQRCKVDGYRDPRPNACQHDLRLPHSTWSREPDAYCVVCGEPWFQYARQASTEA